MKRKDERIAVRLSQEELAKVQTVAALTDCTMSEAVRRIVRATRLQPVVVIDAQPSSEEMVMAL
jgi:hypothetical protein